MPQEQPPRLSTPRLYFVAGLAAGLLVGSIGGYMAHDLLSDSEGSTQMADDDLWYPRGIDRGLENDMLPSLGTDEDTTPDPDIWGTRPSEADPRIGDDASPNPAAGGSAPVRQGGDPSSEPSPSNPSEDGMSPGGARLPEDPSSAFDAPAP